MSRSSLRLSSSGYFCVIALMSGLLLAAPARGQSKDPMGDLPWGAFGGVLGEAINDYKELVTYCAEASARIAVAREKFAKAADGQATEAAWKELEKLLEEKDKAYLFLGLTQGLDEPAESEMFRQRGSIGVLALSGDIDGGIPGPARAAFRAIVEDMREELRNMGAVQEDGGGSTVLLFLPNQFYEARDRCQQQWSVYQFRRNRIEYHRAGKPMPPISDPRTFVIWDLQSQRDLSFDEASKAYDALAAAVGQETMQQTVTAVAESSQDIRGHITDDGLAQLSLISSTDVPKDQAELVGGKIADGRTVVWGTRPMSVLRGLWTRDNPRVTAMFAMADALLLDHATAWRRLGMIEAAVGKQRFETALAEFHAAPRRPADGMLITPVPPGDQVWMHRHYEKLQAALLAGDDAKAQVRYFIAIDPKVTAAEGEDPAAAIDRRYQELAGIKGEPELLASAQKLHAAGWNPRSAGVPTDRVVAALEKMLGLKGELNPHYFQWAGFGPGTTATYELEIHGGLLAAGAPGGVLKIKREVRVQLANEDGMALLVTESKQKRDGSWEASPPKIENIPAYQEPLPPGRADAFWGSLPFVPGSWLAFDPIGPEIDRQETASILIGDAVFDCTRSIWSGPRERAQTFERRNGHPLMGSNVAEVWTNRQVPGWITKAVRALPNSVRVVRLAAFDVKPAGEKLAANAAREAESLAWMRPSESLDRIDPELRVLDPGSRGWVSAPVGSNVTHQFHYKGPSRQRSSVEEELNARIVSTLVEKDREVALVRSIWQDGDDVIERADFELGSATETHYIGNLVTWMASNRQRAHPFLLAGDVARATVTIDGQPVECMSYHHVPLAIPGKQLRAERLVLSDSVPGAIVYLSVRNDPGTGGVPTALTYAIEGLNQKSLPELPQLVIKPKGGNFAIDQELMVEKNGKWERGKILRFTQLPNDAGGRYLIQVGRSPTWYNEEWLREHSRPVSEDDEAAGAAAEAGQTAPPSVAPSPPSRGRQPAPATRGRQSPPDSAERGGAAKSSRGDSGDSDSRRETFSVGNKVRFTARGGVVEATVIQIRGNGLLVEYQDPRRERTVRTWINSSSAEKLAGPD